MEYLSQSLKNKHELISIINIITILLVHNIYYDQQQIILLLLLLPLTNFVINSIFNTIINSIMTYCVDSECFYYYYCY